MSLVQGLHNSEAETTQPGHLQLSDIVCRFRVDSDGFTLIETLIVVLVIGILCATGVSMYAGATADSQLRSIEDEITSFFTACRHRAIMRKAPVTLTYHENFLGISQSSSLRLRIPELDKKSGQMLNGLQIGEKSAIMANGNRISQLQLNIYLPGKRLATISVEL